jgi:peroxiredoxin
LSPRDPTALPSDLPVPDDDGAADHIEGVRIPSIALPTIDGGKLDPSIVPGTLVLFVYPKAGRPGIDPPPEWDAVPGARGCTPQSCAFRDHHAELEFGDALKLPTFVFHEVTLLKRITLIADDGVITKVFYPVFPPDRNPTDVIDWMRGRR